ncbi:MAG TPA: hypothetical protein VLV46_08685 [Gaiellaceae bacterium]|nr:hypothetical protein [Gaiellaceae bacterium]
MSTLDEELVRAAEAAAPSGEVTGVLAAEPREGLRLYLVSLQDGEGTRWIVVDREGAAVDRREDVRSVASIVALCELAADVAGGGNLAELRQELARLRLLEQAPGVAEAEEAADELERVIGVPPRVASPGYLDAVGEATTALEGALGDLSSPFAAALRSGSGAVDEFMKDVERGYALPLR